MGFTYTNVVIYPVVVKVLVLISTLLIRIMEVETSKERHVGDLGNIKSKNGIAKGIFTIK